VPDDSLRVNVVPPSGRRPGAPAAIAALYCANHDREFEPITDIGANVNHSGLNRVITAIVNGTVGRLW
jgi:hypothetical protein